MISGLGKLSETVSIMLLSETVICLTLRIILAKELLYFFLMKFKILVTLQEGMKSLRHQREMPKKLLVVSLEL